MNNLNKYKRRIAQFSLTQESWEILESFAEKYGTSKSIVIDRALRYLAANYHKKIEIRYEMINAIDNNDIDKYNELCDQYGGKEKLNEIIHTKIYD